MDILRTQAGGQVRGVNTGVVQGRPEAARRAGAGGGAGGTTGVGRRRRSFRHRLVHAGNRHLRLDFDPTLSVQGMWTTPRNSSPTSS